MSDTIVFDTEATLKNEPVMYEVKTFALVPESHPVLHEVLPEFDFSNPPVNPNEFASTLVETCKKHKGYGFIEMGNADDALKAIAAFHEQPDLYERKMVVRFADLRRSKEEQIERRKTMRKNKFKRYEQEQQG